MEAATFHAIPTPIVIGSTAPAPYAPTIKHTPLRASDTFYLWRNNDAPCPTHNAIALGAANPKGKWRSFWSDLQIIPNAVFKKSKAEIRLRQKKKASLEQADALESKQASFYNDERDATAGDPKFINDSTARAAKNRSHAWRKEQISQGVLARLLACLGRVMIHQVGCAPCFLMCVVYLVPSCASFAICLCPGLHTAHPMCELRIVP